ncbi:MAG: sigma 54-interacting transcriptional regulator [Myxococcales bacterium]
MNAPRLEGLFTSENDAMRAVFEDAARVGERPDTPVRIQGEVGTGKELLARFIHQSTPTRREAAFVKVACAGSSEGLLEAELSGRADAGPGALERARGGTLFLEDVGELPARLQLELLRTLKTGRFRRAGDGGEGPFEARLVVAATGDLGRAVRQGSFRPDLFHRLDVFRLTLPPLRQRREDILPLARWFLGEFSRQWVRAPKALAADAEQKLLAHGYPGNVRELRNLMESALIAARGERIDAAALSFGSFAPLDELFFAIHLTGTEAPPTMEEVEKLYLERVLRYAKGNRSEVSRVTGLSYPTVARKIAEYGLEVPK